ncbi:MAG: DNA-processing protein DprA [Sphingobacteriales bacterium]|nr:MAG: DNA-processing protein DprA [Sphingobacteriales bacterium]
MLPLQNTSPIFPFREIVAYEALWADAKTSFKTLALMFAKHPGSRPSDFVQKSRTVEVESHLKQVLLNGKNEYKTNLLINGTYDFPEKLKDAQEPIELLYYTGQLDYLHTRCIAIVGTRNPAKKGTEITTEIATKLVKDDFTVVSGLATGIDTAAHRAAINAKGRTIAVIGTPLNQTYPKENSDLQKEIAKEHLLLSQVPFYRYAKQDYRLNRFFFLERNKTMSALTEATLIVEAGDTSGSLTQARAALYQKRKVLIWEDCFHNNSITWPKRFLDKGAIRVSSYEDIKNALGE